jgi:hypothetical protein
LPEKIHFFALMCNIRMTKLYKSLLILSHTAQDTLQNYFLMLMNRSRPTSLAKSRLVLFIFWLVVGAIAIRAQAPDYSTLHRLWPVLPLVGFTILMRSALQRQNKVLETYGILKNRNKMRVRITLESSRSWRWQRPERLRELTVLINGRKTTIPRRVLRDIYPLDVHKNPMIVETDGHTEIVLWGREGSPLNEVRWSFHNHRFSGLRIKRNNQWEISSNTPDASTASTPSDHGLPQLPRSAIATNTDYPSSRRSETDLDGKEEAALSA